MITGMRCNVKSFLINELSDCYRIPGNKKNLISHRKQNG